MKKNIFNINIDASVSHWICYKNKLILITIVFITLLSFGPALQCSSINDAYSAYMRGDYTNSLKLYENVYYQRIKGRDYKPSILGIQSCLVAKKNYFIANEFSKRHINEFRDNKIFVENYAYSSFCTSDFFRAVDLYHATHKMEINNLSVIKWLYRAYFFSGRKERAIDFIKKILNNSNLQDKNIFDNLKIGLYEISMETAVKFYDRGDYELALKYYQECLKNGTDQYESINRTQWLKIGIGIQNCLIMMKRFNEAIDSGISLLENHDSNMKVIINTAYSYYSLLNYNKAVKYYLRAITIDGRNLTAINGLCLSYYYSGKLKSALTVLDNTVDRLGELPELEKLRNKLKNNRYYSYLSGGYNHYLAGEFNRALKKYRFALVAAQNRSSEEKRNAVIGVLNSLVGLKKYNEAIKYGDKFLNRFPHNRLIIKNIAFSYYSLKKYTKAVEYYSMMLEEFENDPIVLSGLGWSYYYSGDLDAAKKILKMAESYQISDPSLDKLKNIVIENIRSTKDKYLVYIRAAFTYYKKADYNIAMDYYRRAEKEAGQKTSTRRLDASIGIQNCIVKLGKYEEAFEKGFSMMIDIPDNSTVLLNTAFSLFKLKRYNEAIDLYERLYSNEAENFSALWGLSWSYYYDGNPGKSREYLKKALKLKDDSGLRKLNKILNENGEGFQLSNYYSAFNYSDLSDKDSGSENDILFSYIKNGENRFDLNYLHLNLGYKDKRIPELVEDSITVNYTRIDPKGNSLLFKTINTNDTTIGNGKIFFAKMNNTGFMLSGSFSDYINTKAYQGNLEYLHIGKNYSITSGIGMIWRDEILNLTNKKEFYVFSQKWIYSFDTLSFHLDYLLGKNSLLVKNSGFVSVNSPDEMNVLASTGLAYKYNNFIAGYSFSYGNGRQYSTNFQFTMLAHTLKLQLKW